MVVAGDLARRLPEMIVEVRAVRAKGLYAADRRGTADPYVAFTLLVSLAVSVRYIGRLSDDAKDR